MATTSEQNSHENPFRGFDESVEHVLGADMRLIYGFAIPILMIVGLIIILGLTPATWLVIAILVMEVAALCVVLTGFIGMLNEPGDDEDTSP
ncbi:MAG TPA: hypothetical protein VMD09_03190 [Solirubrobacteraceae bacterium]|nr:hypothetical protein [Solirubrobacteraceae bacterium]